MKSLIKNVKFHRIKIKCIDLKFKVWQKHPLKENDYEHMSLSNWSNCNVSKYTSISPNQINGMTMTL